MSTETTQEDATGSAAMQTPGKGETTSFQEERRRMIATAAYLRAEGRRFVGGDAEADWLAAEAEVEQRLAAHRQEKERELAAFQRMYKEARRALEDVREKVSAETIKEALDKASATLRQAGEYSGETVSKVAEAVKKDLASAAERLAPKWEALSEDAAGLFAVWQGRSRAFLGGAATATGDWLKELGSRLEHRSYRAGELTGGGTFECTQCGERQLLAQPNHLAECPKCQNNEFRRV
jgi:DNA-binding transcriptional MerR regulator